MTQQKVIYRLSVQGMGRPVEVAVPVLARDGFEHSLAEAVSKCMAVTVDSYYGGRVTINGRYLRSWYWVSVDQADAQEEEGQ